ncbi:MAG: glycosyl hydrolase family 28-related protein [Chthonomonadales bacterium]
MNWSDAGLTALFVFLAASAPAAAPQIPALNWQQRSDWINVRTGVSVKAAGDGRADDTSAIQRALDQPGDGRAVYLPPGVYRITRTLELKGPRVGFLLVGHGRDTTILWDGPAGGTMFRCNGAAYSRFVGISWDGRHRAAVGFDHASELRFETEITHEHEAFRHFTGYGIRIGHRQRLASAEIYYYNCLFEDCDIAVGMLDFNDYDNTFDRCEFRKCRTGIYDQHANFYVRNCHFEESADADISTQSEHGDSVRRCTSYGSRRFIVQRGTIAPLTVQDCRVAAWKDPDGAVVLNGSTALVFDCVFSQPPSARPPIHMVRAEQRLTVSNNEPLAADRLVDAPPGTRILSIPAGRRRGALTSARQSFLVSAARTASRVFDAMRDFGAKGDGRTDDTQAIQNALAAARKAGHAALAYLPAGTYVVTKTLRITGRDYTFGGGGLRSGLVWRGSAGAPMLEVADPRNLTIEHVAVGHPDYGRMTHGDDIRITARPGRPCSLVLDEVYAYGLYQKAPDTHGIRFLRLPEGAVVDARHVQGNLRIEDCSDATLLFRTSYEGTVTVSGGHANSRGLIGFLTRLDTLAGPTLHVHDNASLVMSDFYDEQSESHLLLEGDARLPAGRVTIQGPKTHLVTQQPVIELRGYCGGIYYGQNEFYVEPKTPRVVATGPSEATVLIAGCFFYNSRLQADLPPSVRLGLLGNVGMDDTPPTQDILHLYSAALDDLRRLGEADLIVGAPPSGRVRAPRSIDGPAK